MKESIFLPQCADLLPKIAPDSVGLGKQISLQCRARSLYCTSTRSFISIVPIFSLFLLLGLFFLLFVHKGQRRNDFVSAALNTQARVGHQALCQTSALCDAHSPWSDPLRYMRIPHIGV